MLKNTFITITLITLGYRILGFLRELLIASKFGAGILTDSFFISQTIPNLLLEILALGGISSIIVSVFDFKKRNELIKKAEIIIGNSMLISLLIFFIIYPLSKVLVKIMVPGFEKEQLEITVELTKMTLLTFPLSIINMVISSFLMGINKGYLISFSNFLYNLIILVIGGIFSYKLSIKSFIVGMNIANILKLLFIIYFYKKNIGHLKIKLDFKDETFKKIIKLLIPLIVSTLGIQLNFIIDKIIASTLETGSISQLTYATKLIQLPLGILLGSAILSFYPILVQKLKEDKYEEYLINKLEVIFIVMGMMNIYILLFSDIIVGILFNEKIYSSELIITSKILKYFSFLLIITSITTVFQKIFHGLNETKLPAKITLFCTVINIILSLFLGLKYKVEGIALATIISNLLNVVLLEKKLKERIVLKLYNTEILKIFILHLSIYCILFLAFNKFLFLLVFKSLFWKIVSLGIGLISILFFYYLGLRIFNIRILKKLKE